MAVLAKKSNVSISENEDNGCRRTTPDFRNLLIPNRYEQSLQMHHVDSRHMEVKTIVGILVKPIMRA